MTTKKQLRRQLSRAQANGGALTWYLATKVANRPPPAHVEMPFEGADEFDVLLTGLQSILTRTADTLKGKPKPLHNHDWSNLPEAAQRWIDLVGDLVMPGDCAYDENGWCQVHRWFEPDVPCPHQRAKQLLEETGRG